MDELRERIARVLWAALYDEGADSYDADRWIPIASIVLAAIAETGELHPKGTGEAIGRLREAAMWLHRLDRDGYDSGVGMAAAQAWNRLTPSDLGEPPVGEG